MRIVFTDHAKRRIRERNLTLKDVRVFLGSPDSIEPSSKNPKRFLLKRLYYHPILKRRHLLMAICEQEKKSLIVVTVIDTSQITKYS